jgi:hypothetical protein
MSKRLTEIGFKNGTKICLIMDVERVIDEWCKTLKAEATHHYWKTDDMLINVSDVVYIIPDEYLGESP